MNSSQKTSFRSNLENLFGREYVKVVPSELSSSLTLICQCLNLHKSVNDSSSDGMIPVKELVWKFKNAVGEWHGEICYGWIYTRKNHWRTQFCQQTDLGWDRSCKGVAMSVHKGCKMVRVQTLWGMNTYIREKTKLTQGRRQTNHRWDATHQVIFRHKQGNCRTEMETRMNESITSHVVSTATITPQHWSGWNLLKLVNAPIPDGTIPVKLFSCRYKYAAAKYEWMSIHEIRWWRSSKQR